MTRTEYLTQLEHYLKKLPPQDFQEAMDYFTEYFDEAGPDQESQVMLELGTPQEAASDIITNILGKKAGQVRGPRSTAQLAGIILLALAATPVALPIIFGGLALIVGLLLTCLAILIAGSTTSLSLVFLAAYLGWDSISLLTVSTPVSLSALGFALGILGLGILAGLVTYLIAKGLFKLAAFALKKVLKRGA